MRGWLSSPRRRRRFGWLGTIGLVLGAIVCVFVFWGNTGDNAKVVYDTGPVQYTPQPHEIKPSGTDVKAAQAVAARFILTALGREHLAESYDLASPGMKQGMSRDEWNTGNIPVPTFPLEQIGQAREKLSFAFKDDISFDVLVMPKPNATMKAVVFTAELKAYGKGHDRHWLVDSWQPSGVAESTSAQGPGAQFVQEKAPLSAAWLLVPLGILSLIILIPVGYGVRGWRRNRRAIRAYTSSSRPS